MSPIIRRGILETAIFGSITFVALLLLADGKQWPLLALMVLASGALRTWLLELRYRRAAQVGSERDRTS
ncbi:hypothetical protein [Longispora albida]|uniref:hypothetical protein n=1 Tax=Longispora albida TaxID=203523 RepID=UPI00036B1441|nr:hypothetical protein [Longispora albida]